MSEEAKKEKLSEEEIGRKIAAGRQRRKQAQEARKEYHRKRSILRKELALRKGITYRYLRPCKRLKHCKDGRTRSVQPAKGGIVVAYQAQDSNQMRLAVSICLPNDTFDKLEGKRRAYERLLFVPQTDPTEDGLGVMHVCLTGRAEFRDSDFLPAMIRAVVRNAVANLRKVSDRRWFAREILPSLHF